ncbi:MAG TPA: hypothetical protein PK629_11275 [Oscillospiraceae bacterium]|nr:hypothetical protein [Oscillospiraceae bacterium]HPF55565.1 hypothetical protein [Clostridiales bacterium]HPK34648.1 hypothetical protein [Oscillospiraceae bacterium]HPR74587.1 hypothetical protein [Oscillospiraceae bacterium]
MNDFLWGDCTPKPAVLSGLKQLPFSDFYHLLFEHSTGAIFTDKMLEELISADPEVIRMRQELIREMIQNKQLTGCFRRFSDEYVGWREYVGNRFEDGGDAIANIDPCGHVTAVFDAIDNFLHALQNAQSPLAKNFKTKLETLRNDLSLDRFKEIWKKAYYDISNAKSYTVGLNMDENLLPCNCKLLSVNQKPDPQPKKSLQHFLLHSGYYKIMLGRQQNLWLSMRRENKDFMDYIAAFPAGFNRVLTDTSIDLRTDVKNFMRRILAVLAPYAAGAVFYLAAVNLIHKWEKAGIGWCFPQEKTNAFEAQELYDPLLLDKIGKNAAVPNDLVTENEIGIVTGANAGGKTRYLVAVLTAQLLYQLGFPVPARSASIGAADTISAVFADEESGKIGAGRLGEELTRLAEAVAKAQTGNAFFAFNEALTGTSSRDAAEIMGETICTLMNAGARGLIVTHLLKLAAYSEDFNENIIGSRLIPLTAQVTEDLKPTYKIIPAPSARTSYAKTRFTTVG